jgi:hypothetical protein
MASSNKAKGNQYEIEVKKHLEAEGWTVFRQHRKPLWIKKRMITVGADIFGCDIIAKKKGHLTKWIQVSADGAKSKKEDQLNEFPWDTNHESVEIWLRVEGKKAFRVFMLEGSVLPGGGLGQQFVEKELCHIRHTSAKAQARLLPGGAGFIR